MDDWLISVAWFSQGVSAVLDIFAMRNGLAVHIDEVNQGQLLTLGRLTYIIQIIYIVSITTVKLSVLSTYLRIFTIGKIRPIIRTMMAVLVLICFASCMATIFQCVPVLGNFFQSYFNRPGDKCLNGWALQYSVSGFIICTDIITLILPIKRIWEIVTLTRLRRLGIIFIFSLGFFACIASALRIYVIHRLILSQDRTWETFGFSFSCSLEVSLGIIAVSFPAIKPLVTRYTEKPQTRHSSIESGMKGFAKTEYSERGRLSSVGDTRPV